MTPKKTKKEIEIKTAKQLLEEEKQIKRLETNTPIDELLDGGIREDEVIEFYGPYGAGKTQIALTLTAQVAAENGHVIFIDCEHTFRPKRLKQIAKSRGYNPDEILKHVYIIQPLTVEQQIAALDSIPKNIKPKLIIVDGVTTLFRAEYQGRQQLYKRQPLLGKHLKQLKNYAKTHKTPIIITNQVYANPDGTPFMPIEFRELAVGGHTLYHAINNRIFIRRAKGNKRIARLVDSSEYPQQERAFKITDKGIETITQE